MANDYINSIKNRRTYYSLADKSPISDSRIIEIAEEILRHTPSALNSQSTRFVILLGSEHKLLWRKAREIFREIESPDDFKVDEKKLSDREAGYGTILLYEDRAVTAELEANFPRYAIYMSQFAEHAHGMQAIHLWTALELEGLGCNLQHFNPYIDQMIVAHWKVPATWSLKAQLVFGTPTAGPNPSKTFKPVEERIFVHGPKKDRVGNGIKQNGI